ncbi:hypothetical protein ACFQVC_31260 [Streptomyces monticola]|uniref:DUF4386 domain-containing protein n=1 Tax=Streptomyces monticola TaxID=2666263 RepID=A0ABW2JRU0_9ACTN
MVTSATSVPTASGSRMGSAGNRRLFLGGAGFAGLFLGGMGLAGLLGTGVYPSPLDSEAAAASYFAANGSAVLAQGVAHLFAGVALAVFASALGNGRASAVGWARVAGWAAAVAVAVSGLVNATIAVLGTTGDSLHTLHYLSFLAGGQIHVPLLGVLVAAGARAYAGSTPRWTTVPGVVAAVLAVLSLVSFAIEDALLLLPLGRFTSILWIVITVVRARPRK